MSMRGRWMAPPVGSFLNASSCTRMQSSMVRSCETRSLLMMSMGAFSSGCLYALSHRAARTQRARPASRRCVTAGVLDRPERRPIADVVMSRHCDAAYATDLCHAGDRRCACRRPDPAGARRSRRAILQGQDHQLPGRERARRRQRPDRPADLAAPRQAHPGQSQHRGAEPAVVRAGARQPHLQRAGQGRAHASRSSSAACRRSRSWAIPTRASIR